MLLPYGETGMPIRAASASAVSGRARADFLTDTIFPFLASSEGNPA